jgi:hypothetical protein
MRDLSEDFNLLKKSWPSALVARSEVGRFSGGIISARYLANLDCRGLGPAERIRIGRKIAYPVDILIKFLQEKATKLGPTE